MDVQAGYTYQWKGKTVTVVNVKAERHWAYIAQPDRRKGLKKVKFSQLMPTRETTQALSKISHSDKIARHKMEVAVVEALDVTTEWNPATPTDALPGTEEKINVMALRYSLNQPLWHPDDAVGDFEPTQIANGIWKL